MRKCSILALFVFAGVLQAQPAWVNAAKKWSGTISASTSYQETDLAGGKHTLQMRLSGSFEMAPPTDDSPYSFVGNVTGTSISISYRGNGNDGCPFEDVFDASGPTIAESPTARLTTRSANWNFTGGIYRLKGNLTRTRKCSSGTFVTVYEDEQPSVVMSLPSMPYPASGQTLSHTGKITFPVQFSPSFFNITNGSPFDYTLTLAPGGTEEVELELFSGQYQDWRPTAQADGGDGEAIEFTATLKTKDGGVPQQKAEKMEWELVETSREPGVAINWPQVTAQTLPDLHFNEVAGVSGTIGRETVGDEGLKVVTTFLDGAGLTDRLKVYPRDWGGWSTLRVTAILPGGKRVTGKYRGATEADVRLPDRDSGDRVARAWKKAKGVSAGESDDSEDAPAGDGNRGDGLTLYEEYRGFYEEGEHAEGNPKKKDYFAVNQAGGAGRGGLALFQRISGLVVHGKLTIDELSADRVINHNYQAGAHVVDQHGVLVKEDASFAGFAQAVSRVDHPATPRDIDYVGLPSTLPGRPTASPAVSYASATVAHELLHTVNVYHHGETDVTVFWSRDAEGKLYEQATEDQGGQTVAVGGKAEIRAFTEQGQDVTAQVRLGMRELGKENGQHAGWENCVMRYDIADSYISRANANDRYVGIREVAGARLCDTREGITVNQPGRIPQPRYGVASSGRGNCAGQLVVNDRVNPAVRK